MQQETKKPPILLMEVAEEGNLKSFLQTRRYFQSSIFMFVYIWKNIFSHIVGKVKISFGLFPATRSLCWALWSSVLFCMTRGHFYSIMKMLYVAQLKVLAFFCGLCKLVIKTPMTNKYTNNYPQLAKRLCYLKQQCITVRMVAIVFELYTRNVSLMCSCVEYSKRLW